jgi:regulator of RNase E activity RraA
LSQEIRQRLIHLDTCLVSDAMDRMGLSGTAPGLARLSTDRKVAGPVLTVKLEAANGRLAERHLCTAAIEAARPGDVIVVEHHARADCAGWGGILTRAARLRGVAGVVVDGICRDIDESRELQFPVFARGTHPATARGRVIETGYNCPVRVGNAVVRPGDWVLADGTGVVFLPQEHLQAILDQAEKLAAREASLVKEIEAGTPVSRVMSQTYETMTRKDEKP